MVRYVIVSAVSALVAFTALLGALIVSEDSAAAAAHRSCGLFVDTDGARIGVLVLRGGTPCATARSVLRAYLTSNAPCDGSACVRRMRGWTCASAAAYALPRLASCDRGKQRIAAYSTAD